MQFTACLLLNVLLNLMHEVATYLRSVNIIGCPILGEPLFSNRIRNIYLTEKRIGLFGNERVFNQ